MSCGFESTLGKGFSICSLLLCCFPVISLQSKAAAWTGDHCSHQCVCIWMGMCALLKSRVCQLQESMHLALMTAKEKTQQDIASIDLDYPQPGGNTS